MPLEERRRCDEKRRPADAPQAPAGRRQEQPVGCLKRRSPHVTTQDRQFVAEHNDLEIPRLRRSEQKEDELQHAVKRDVNDGQ
jgi:hypothetical protein